MAAMSYMHSVYALPSILLGAFSTGDQVHHILGFTGQMMSDLVGQASVVALELDTFLQPWTEQTLSSSSTMLVSVASRRLEFEITAVRVGKLLQSGPDHDLSKVPWLPV